MRVTITRAYAFEAGHRLRHLPLGHKCLRSHGHSYKVWVTVSRAMPLPEDGMVMEASVLDGHVRRYTDALDHRQLHKLPLEGSVSWQAMVRQPTAENIAAALFDAITGSLFGSSVVVDSVEVSETDKLSARVTRGGL